MKISEVIEGLKKIQQAHGDLDCIYEFDEEGSRYKRTEYLPSLFYETADRYAPIAEWDDDIKDGIGLVACIN